MNNTKFFIEKEDIASIALEVWKLESALEKSFQNFSDTEKERFSQRTKRLKELLERMNVEIRDFSGKVYNSGISALEIVDSIHDPNTEKSLVKETISPAIYISGELFKRSKIIISYPQKDE